MGLPSLQADGAVLRRVLLLWRKYGLVPRDSSLSLRLRLTVPLLEGILQEDVPEIVPQAQVVEVNNVPHRGHLLPVSDSRDILLRPRRQLVVGGHHDLLYLGGPPRPSGLSVALPWPVCGELPGEGIPVLDILLPLGPLERLVCRGAAVDEVHRVQEQAPD